MWRIMHMQQNFEIDELDQQALNVALSATALRLRTLIVEEIGGRPEVYEDLLDSAKTRRDPSLESMEAIVQSIEDGKDIRSHYEKISRLIHGQDSRAEIFGSLSQTHNYHRYVEFLKARGKIETVLLAIADRGKLTPGDALAMLHYIEGNIRSMEAQTASNSTSGKDIAALLGKIDYLVDRQQQNMQKQMAHTTPQNREIMRRVATKLLKAAKPSKTT